MKSFCKKKFKIYNIFQKLRNEDFTDELKIILDINQNNDCLNDYIKKNLVRLLTHSSNHVPFYNNFFGKQRKNGIIEKINISNFYNIPIISKSLLKSDMKKFISDDYKCRKSYENFSGGSTGEPTKFIQNVEYRKWVMATNSYYYNHFLGLDEAIEKKIIIWGSPRDLERFNFGLKNEIGNWLTNTVFLNSFRMSELEIENKIQKINSYKPSIIRGYANSLYELCKYSEKNNINLYSPKIIISSAETLTFDMREKIEEIFGTELYDFYGSRETASIAAQCKAKSYHIFSFNNYLEILDNNNKPVDSGEKGRVIVTNLHNYSMPFLRYDIGDMATLGPKKCKCGNILPTLNSVEGRVEEQFVKSDGTIVIGYYFVHLMGVIQNKGYLEKFQVIQEDYDKIRILAELTKPIPEKEISLIEKGIRMQMGKECKIKWDFVDEIKKAKSGKYIYTKSLVIKK